jgi:hypothetical protein
MKNDCLAAALEELAKAGIRTPTVARGGKHLQLRWAGPHGEPRMATVACTPGDPRSLENTRRDVRRILRADGMLDGAPASPPARQPSRIELVERKLVELEQRQAELEQRLAEKGAK